MKLNYNGIGGLILFGSAIITKILYKTVGLRTEDFLIAWLFGVLGGALSWHFFGKGD